MNSKFDFKYATRPAIAYKKRDVKGYVFTPIFHYCGYAQETSLFALIFAFLHLKFSRGIIGKAYEKRLQIVRKKNLLTENDWLKVSARMNFRAWNFNIVVRENAR